MEEAKQLDSKVESEKENKTQKTVKIKPENKKSVVREYIEAIAWAIILALIIRTFIVQAFRIPSGSMEDTLLVGDFLLANKFIYGAKVPFLNVRLPAIQKPKQGDIVIFKYPRDPSKDFIKRVVATQGQTVEIREKEVFVDGRKVLEPPKSKHIYPDILPSSISMRDNFGPVVVPSGCLFVMGDNRDNSQDSRYWGMLPFDNVKGKAMILYWSWNSERPIWDIIHKIRWGRLGCIIR